ncbi:Pleiotropic drug resistance protein ABC Superfamily [Phytophthora palmivora]|uniref:Pleiotropic drug resistance protein ABC Superfamily n=1 Tax=Phytophthora palmivora TaxID=4796 RepID=A0A2P4WZQ5_9STRA|nr:Pleiotropic drug resistance protein ABC Superfamily [Phytophthora palmivora]
MEVRFHNISISAHITVKDETNIKTELPTLTNTVKMTAIRMNTKKNIVKKEILRNVSGVLKPGTMTLVLGQPGSGKSSLLKVLGGRFPTTKRVHIDGEVTYNGTSQDKFGARLPQFVSYVDQHDKHFPTLTVKETLEFANACTGANLSKREEKLYSHGTDAQNQAAVDVLRTTYQHYPNIMIQQLGLENCQNNIMGNAMVRGVSGGERKRVTTGEMAFGNKFVLLMDEISTGLDSAATFDIISTQHSLAKTLKKTVMISLLQPSPEVFALFDDVILLNDGYVMYHGPRAQVLGYFESLGFKCPANRDVADFLLDLGTNKQYQYEDGIRGEILLNGYPATELAIRRATGYCEQMDIHSDASTFREALTFSAFLRQDADVPDNQKYDSVNECLDLLDLHPIADHIIRGSSTEQMKRLTIGVELAAQPSVLFLDEPTSGLDARSAKLIMDGVRKVADTGRTIVCTIHQPSVMVFSVFDSLLLLKRGGEMVFFGDLGANASNLVKYFESIDGVTQLEEGCNPASWMLEVIGAGVGSDIDAKTDFVAMFKASTQYLKLEEDLDQEGYNGVDTDKIKDKSAERG